MKHLERRSRKDLKTDDNRPKTTGAEITIITNIDLQSNSTSTLVSLGNDDDYDTDLEDDLNLDAGGQNVVYFAFEHPIPVVPNIKIKMSDMSSS